ncbi:B12-binding domain-containing radical SAM protein [Bacteroidota bacterium]
MKQKTVVFIYPKTGPNLIKPPFGAMALATIFKEKGFDYEFIDSRIDNYKKRLSEVMEKKSVLFVGTSAMTGPQISHALQISRFVKENFKVPVVWGGIHASSFPEQTLENKLIDIILMGDAEITAVNLAEALTEKKPLKNLKGIGFKEKNKIIINKPDSTTKLKVVPKFSWNLIDVNKYMEFNLIGKRTISMFTSRGCPLNCSFCYAPLFHKHKWIAQKAEDIIEEIDYLKSKYDFDGLFFNDDNFLVDFKRAKKIGSELKKRGITYGISLTVSRFNEDIAKFLGENNCERIDFGGESGSQKILDEVSKKQTPEEIIKVVKLAKKYGINACISFVIGHPKETNKDLNATLDLIDELLKINPNLTVNSLKILTPYPGSKFFFEAQKYGFKPPEKLEDWAEFYWENVTTPWIKNKWKYEAITFASLIYFFRYRLKQRKKLFNLIIDILVPIEKFRWKKRFWSFPIEIFLMKKVVDRINSSLK